MPTVRSFLAFLSMLLTFTALTGVDIDFASPHAAYATGSGPRTVAIGRLDNNTSNDLVVGNQYSGTISVLLNNGSGTFGPKTDLAIPGYPSAVAIVDLNGDGKNDVVVSNQTTPGHISVFLGNGAGGLLARTDFTASSPLVAMRVIDVDGDGKLDVIATGTGIDFFKGDGAGGFAAAVPVLTTGYTNSVTVGDLNGDGKIDIACTRDSRLTTLLGNGDGTFAAPVTHATGADDLSVGMGDFNGDGLNDLAETHYYGPSYEVAVLLNLGGGTFAPATAFATGKNPKSLMVDDLDADGHQDLVCVDSGGFTVSILRGKGDGTFHPRIGYLTGSTPYVDAIADLDGNGSHDIAAVNMASNTVSVLRQGTGATPNKVNVIIANPVSDQYAKLSWTAPLVESYGSATNYDMRMMLGNASAYDFAVATPVLPGPEVGPGGSVASFLLSNLTTATTYSVAFTATDAFGRTSPLSGICTFTTAATDIMPPSAPSINWTWGGNNYYYLGWVAPGDDADVGQAVAYDLRMSTTAIVDDATFAAATPVPTSAPKLGGMVETMYVGGLTPNTTYYFAVTARDEVPLTSARSSTRTVTTSASDTSAPATVTDLAVTGTSISSITVRWTARGDDYDTGLAAAYDLRWSHDPIIDLATFQAATQVTGVPAPAMPGMMEQVVISGLTSDTPHYVALRIADEIPNLSGISNVIIATTLDGTAPAAISDLSITTPTSSSLALTWTAPGDDGASGTATAYDIRYSTAPITDTSTFAAATAVAGVAAPQIAGTVEHLTLTGLTAATTWYVAIRAVDEVPNSSGISNVANGTTSASGGGTGTGGGGSSGGKGCGLGSGLAALLTLLGFLLGARLRPR